jgi:hypothetical protein
MRDRVARCRFFHALLIVLALGAVGCADIASRAPSSPTSAPSTTPAKITVSPETQAIDVVGLGEDAVGEVLVRNEGGRPLTLEAHLPRGTRVEGLVPELKPGESVRLRFVVNTFEAEGNRRQTWALVTNDPDRPRVLVTLEVDVRPFLVARPGYARYITVQHAREGTISQTIASTDGADFRVLRVESGVAALRIEFREATAGEREPAWPGRQWRVMTTLASDAPVGPIIGPIMVYTDHPRQKRVLIPLSGFVRPMLAVTPSEARIGDVKRTRTDPVRFFVRNFAEEEIELTSASTDVAAVKAEIAPIERGRSWNLNLFIMPGSPVGPFEGKVVLHTASPKIPSLELPLRGRLVE